MKWLMAFGLVALLGFECGSVASADQGGWTGNGGEPQRLAENIWFVNQERVPYCIDVSANYPVPLSQLRSLISESFDQWFDFFKSYGIDGVSKRRLPLLPANALNKTVGMALQFYEVDCSASSEHFSLEKLRFHFGVSNPIIDAYRTFNPEEPLGLAMKKARDERGLDTYGYVWLDAFSSDPQRVKHLLLHEIGHVLGMAHHSVFVMNQSVVDDVSPSAAVDGLGAIESSFWPYRLRQDNAIELSLEGFVGPPPLEGRDRFSLCNQGTPVAKGLYRELALKPQECYAFSLSTKSIDAQRIQVVLEIKSSSQTQTLRGEFRPFPLTDMLPKGPKFQTLMAEPKQWVTYLFDPTPVLDSWQGNIDVNGRSMAAQMFMSRGIVLHLHLPSLNDWVMLRSNGKK